MHPFLRRVSPTRLVRVSWLVVLSLALVACAAPENPTSQATLEEGVAAGEESWSQVLSAAQGQTVDVWMYGGDQQGNAYVDDVLAPAAAELGVTLRRVPVAATTDAMTRILAERQAGATDGEVDLVWVNGDNFAAGKQADAWLCGWAADLPNAEFVDPEDPLVAQDFGTDVDGCESPWHKAQFTFVYDSAAVSDPPTSLPGLLAWVRANPGRFTYPAPPDFTGSVFVREVLYSSAGGYQKVPARFDQAAFDELSPAAFDLLADLAPSLWRGGRTYPQDSVALDRLFAEGQIDFTMTYGPATLTKLVADKTFPETTRVLTLEEGTIGNASFLAIPASSPDSAGAKVVANLALSPEQQVAKADPGVWGQFTVLDTDRLRPADAAAFAELPASQVVPDYEVLARNANPELSSDWVPALDNGWRKAVAGAGS